jgi:hypothetical protein
MKGGRCAILFLSPTLLSSVLSFVIQQLVFLSRFIPVSFWSRLIKALSFSSSRYALIRLLAHAHVVFDELCVR